MGTVDCCRLSCSRGHTDADKSLKRLSELTTILGNLEYIIGLLLLPVTQHILVYNLTPSLAPSAPSPDSLVPKLFPSF